MSATWHGSTPFNQGKACGKSIFYRILASGSFNLSPAPFILVSLASYAPEKIVGKETVLNPVIVGADLVPGGACKDGDLSPGQHGILDAYADGPCPWLVTLLPLICH
jgi:hypothetical protein